MPCFFLIVTWVLFYALSHRSDDTCLCHEAVAWKMNWHSSVHSTLLFICTQAGNDLIIEVGHKTNVRYYMENPTSQLSPKGKLFYLFNLWNGGRNILACTVSHKYFKEKQLKIK